MNFEQFKSEVQATLDLDYEFTQTRSSYEAVARKDAMGIAWSYDCMEKTWQFSSLEKKPSGSERMSGTGRTIRDAFANRTSI